MEAMRASSVRSMARAAGALYLGEILAHMPGLLIRGRLVVPADAGATATNILAHAQLVRLAYATDLVGFASYVAVTALLYEILKPVNRSVSLLAAFFSLVGSTVGAFSCLLAVAPLVVLSGGDYLRAFPVAQVQGLAYVFLNLHAQCFNMTFVFFGLYCVLVGYLIAFSGFLPRVLGAGMAVAGLGWLTFLWPPLAHLLSPYILVPGIIGEGSLTLWLLIAGVNEERWRARAAV